MTERKLLRTMRTRVRNEVRKSRKLKQERKRASAGKNSQFFAAIAGLFLLFFLSGVIAGPLPEVIDKPDAIWCYTSLFITATAWVFAFVLNGQTRAADALMVYSLLPVPDRRVFVWQSKNTLRSGFWWSCVIGVVLFVAFSQTGAITFGTAVELSLLLLFQVFTAGALAIIAIWLRLTRLLFLSFLLFVAILISSLFLRSFLGEQLQSWLLMARPWVAGLTPAGWVDSFWRLGVMEGQSLMLLYAVPMFALWTAAAATYRRMLETYHSPVCEMPGEFPQYDTVEEDNDAAAVPVVLAGRLFDPVEWHTQGPLERCVGWILKDDERAAADLMLGGPMKLTRRLLYGVGLCVLAVMAHALSGSAGSTPSALFLVWGAGLALFGGSWRSGALVGSLGVRVPLYAFSPISYRRMFVIFLKVNFIRCAAFTPICLLLVWAMVQSGPVSEIKAVSIFAKIIVCYAVVQPLLFVFQMSAGTNDTSRSCFTVLALVVGALFVLAAGGTFLAADSLFAIFIAFVCLLISTWGTAYFYLRRLERSKVDLIS